MRLPSRSQRHVVQWLAATQLPQRAAQAPAAAVGVKRHPVVFQEIPPHTRRLHAEAPQIVVSKPPGRLFFHRVEQPRDPDGRRPRRARRVAAEAGAIARTQRIAYAREELEVRHQWLTRTT